MTGLLLRDNYEISKEDSEIPTSTYPAIERARNDNARRTEDWLTLIEGAQYSLATRAREGERERERACVWTTIKHSSPSYTESKCRWWYSTEQVKWSRINYVRGKMKARYSRPFFAQRYVYTERTNSELKEKYGPQCGQIFLEVPFHEQIGPAANQTLTNVWFVFALTSKIGQIRCSFASRIHVIRFFSKRIRAEKRR